MENSTILSISSTTTAISTTTEKPHDFLYYANDVLLVMTFTIVPLALLSQSILAYQIWRRKLSKDLSPILLINIGCWIIYLFLVSIRRVYLTPRAGSPDKNVYFLLYFGTMSVASGQLVPISVFFLALDRIIGILAPTTHRQHKQSLTTITLMSLLAVLLFYVTVIVFIQPFPSSPLTACDTVPCTQSEKVTTLFYGWGLCINFSSVSTCLFFNLTLFKYWNTHSESEVTRAQFKKANYITLVACISEIVFRFIPQTLNFYTLNLHNAWSDFFSLLATNAMTIDASVTAAMYRYMVLKNANSETPIVSLVGESVSPQAIYNAEP